MDTKTKDEKVPLRAALQEIRDRVADDIDQLKKQFQEENNKSKPIKKESK